MYNLINDCYTFVHGVLFCSNDCSSAVMLITEIISPLAGPRTCVKLLRVLLRAVNPFYGKHIIIQTIRGKCCVALLKEMIRKIQIMELHLDFGHIERKQLSTLYIVELKMIFHRDINSGVKNH